MIKDIVDEEKLSSSTLYIGYIKRFIFFRIPFLALIGYSVTSINYISFAYLCFGLLLMNLEMEKYFSMNKQVGKLQADKYTRIRDMLTFTNYRICVYYLLLIFSLAIYIAKFVVLIIFYTKPETYELIKAKINPNDFELYFMNDAAADTAALETRSLIMTFIPNLIVLLISGVTILLQSYLANIRIDTLGNLKSSVITRYFLILCIVLAVLNLGILKVSFTGLSFISLMVIYFLIWSQMEKKSSKSLFYFFAKVFQILSILLIIFHYSVSIDAISPIIQAFLTKKHISLEDLGVVGIKAYFKDSSLKVFFKFVYL